MGSFFSAEVLCFSSSSPSVASLPPLFLLSHLLQHPQKLSSCFLNHRRATASSYTFSRKESVRVRTRRCMERAKAKVVPQEAVVKTAKKIHNQKVAELTSNDIFKGDASPGSAEKSLTVAKLREMSGSDIFADGKAASRDYLGGVRKPPGGESTIARGGGRTRRRGARQYWGRSRS